MFRHMKSPISIREWKVIVSKTISLKGVVAQRGNEIRDTRVWYIDCSIGYISLAAVRRASSGRIINLPEDGDSEVGAIYFYNLQCRLMKADESAKFSPRGGWGLSKLRSLRYVESMQPDEQTKN